MNQDLQLALDSAHRNGISALPAATDGSKRPAGAWKSYQENLPTLARLGDFKNADADGIVAICGKVSGHLEMVELEGDAVERGLLHKLFDHAKAVGLQDVMDRLSTGFVEKSPRGGVHFLYRCPDGVEGNMKLASRVTDDGEIKVQIETRGEGGLVVVAPSGGRTHPTGKPWEMVAGGFDTIPVLTGTERRQLLDLARSFDEMPSPSIELPTTPQGIADGPRGAVSPTPATSDKPGHVFNREHTWDDVLGPAGWTKEYEADGETYWKRPGKAEQGNSATTNYKGADVLKVFSTSTPFSTERTYDRFGAWAVLQGFGDDLSSAGRAVRHPDPPRLVDDLLAPRESVGSPGASVDNSEIIYERPWRSALREPKPFLVRGWIEASTVSAIFGDSDVGKSWTTLGLACAVATGTRWLGNDVREPMPVVYYAAESRAHASRRIAGIAEYLKLDERLLDEHLFLVDPPAGAPWPIKPHVLRGSVERRSAALLVIDTLSAASWLEEEADNGAAAGIIASLTGIADDLGTHVMVVHHSGKDASKGQRGASALRANVRAEFNVVRLDNGLVLRATKMNNAPAPPAVDLRLEVFELADPPTAWGVSSTSAVMVVDGGRVPDAMREITELVKIVDELGGLHVKRGEIVTKARSCIGISARTADDRLARAVRVSRLVRDDDGYSTNEKSSDWLATHPEIGEA